MGRGKSRNERAVRARALRQPIAVGDNRPCPGDSAPGGAEPAGAAYGQDDGRWPPAWVLAIAISTLAGVAAFLCLPAGGSPAALWILTACSLALARRRGPAGARPRADRRCSSRATSTSFRSASCGSRRSPAAAGRRRRPIPGSTSLSADRRIGSHGRDPAPGRDRARPRGRRRGPRPRTRRAEGGRRKAGPGAARGAKARSAVAAPAPHRLARDA